MKIQRTIGITVLLTAVALLPGAGSVAAGPPAQDSNIGDTVLVAATVSSKISYQGRLTDAGGNPLNGNYNLVFQLWNDATAGSQVGSTITKNNVPVSSGVFTVDLSVPQSAFDGQALWLRISVNGQWLSPRQELLPVPYAFGLIPGAEMEAHSPGSAFSVINTTVWLSTTDVNCGGYFEHSNASGVYGKGTVGVQGVASGGGQGVYGGAGSGQGVYGKSTGGGQGVKGEVTAGGRAVYGVASGGTVSSAGYAGYFEGTGDYDGGIVAKAGRYTWAGDFFGKVAVRSRSGGLVLEMGEGLDYAEGFDVSDEGEIAPGTVLVIDPDNPGMLAVSAMPYDTRVAGIVAGAKGLGSGVRLGVDQYDHDVALAGRVYCNADATEAGIEPGDLLTTSAMPGYAMKVTDHARAQGAILGKAMEPLAQGQTGQILVLVTLQ